MTDLIDSLKQELARCRERLASSPHPLVAQVTRANIEILEEKIKDSSAAPKGNNHD